MSGSAERVRLETIADGVVEARLMRPEKMNAVDRAMIEALVETGARLDVDKSVRAVVLSGEGRAFCAGLDMAEFERMARAKLSGGAGGDQGGDLDLMTRSHGDANALQQMAMVWRRLRAPVIAAAHGVVYGAGLQIMMGADIRILHPEAKLSVLEVQWGLIPDLGASVLLPFQVREDIARELTYTGRVFSGAEAQGYGFATHLSETPREEAIALAQRIAQRSPSAVQSAKRLYNAVQEMTPAQRLMLESELQNDLIGSPNQIEAAMAALQKREPSFKD